jgi:hypothetical protein
VPQGPFPHACGKQLSSTEIASTSGLPITNRGKPQKLKAQGRLQGTGCEVLDGCFDLGIFKVLDEVRVCSLDKLHSPSLA